MPKKENTIVFIGDSQTQFFPLDELFPVKILNRGISGDISRGVVDRLSEVSNRKPAKLFIQIGINDLIRHIAIEEIINNYKVILEKLQQESPQTKVYVQSVLPYGPLNDQVLKLNKQIKHLADTEKVIYIDLYTSFVENGTLNSKYDCGDNLHLSGEGYLLWRDIVSSYVAEP